MLLLERSKGHYLIATQKFQQEYGLETQKLTTTWPSSATKMSCSMNRSSNPTVVVSCAE